MRNMDFHDLEVTAQLAQLELSDADKVRLGKEIDLILEYFDSMGRIDVENLEPTTHVLMKRNRTREDREGESGLKDSLIGNAPEIDGRFITVPRIL